MQFFFSLTEQLQSYWNDFIRGEWWQSLTRQTRWQNTERIN